MKTCLVIPCYNEAQRLFLSAYAAYFEGRPDVSFVFVDDGSTDGTLALLKSFAAGREGRVTVIANPKNAGKAEAVRIGVLHSLKAGAPDWIGFMDADLAAPLLEIDHLLAISKAFPTVSIVFASRVSSPGARITRSPVRRLCGMAFASAARLLLGITARDTQCGAKLFRTAVAAETFREKFLSRWLFDLELFLRAAALQDAKPGMFAEFPLGVWTEKGASRIGFSDLTGIVVDFVLIVKKYGLRCLAGRGLFMTHTELVERKSC